MLSYECPFGGTVLLSHDADELRDKIETHNVLAHGTNPIVTCGRVTHLPTSDEREHAHIASIVKGSPRPARRGFSLRRGDS